jgi:hypothetical protein
MSVFRKTEKVERIEDAINFINNRISVDDSTASATNFLPLDSITLASRDQLAASSTLNILARCHVQDDELNSSSDQNEMKIPSELISHCLATLLMIQVISPHYFLFIVVCILCRPTRPDSVVTTNHLLSSIRTILSRFFASFFKIYMMSCIMFFLFFVKLLRDMTYLW